jgi:hypothetical protein
MSERLFTLQEALQTLPAAAHALLQVQDWKAELEERSGALERLLNATEGNGHLAQDIAEARAGLQEAAEALDRAFREMDALGVELKGIDNGLLDFPSLKDGRVVYLCWRQGEETIAYWHEVEAGFAGRQLIREG